jgi:hypothetical protein
MYRGGGGQWDDGQQRAGLAAHRHMHELAGRSGTTAGGGQVRQQSDGFFSFTESRGRRGNNERVGVGGFFFLSRSLADDGGKQRKRVGVGGRVTYQV